MKIKRLNRAEIFLRCVKSKIKNIDIKRTLSSISLCFVIGIIICFGNICIVAQLKKAAKPHSVETFYLAGIEAFNRHDLNEFTKQFAPDISMYTPTGWLRGDKSVRERFAQTFQQFPKVKMVIEDLRVTEVSSKTAIIDFKWNVYPMGFGPAFHGVGSGVYVKRNGKWIEVLEHETVVKVDPGLGNR